MNQNGNKTETYFAIEAMTGLFVKEHELANEHRRIFRNRTLADNDYDELHAAIQSAVAKEKKSLSVKAEIFAVLYVCQPEAIFRRRRLTRTVTRYMRKCLGLSTAALSSHKQNLLFLYYNDKRFKEVAKAACDVAISHIKKNQQSN